VDSTCIGTKTSSRDELIWLKWLSSVLAWPLPTDMHRRGTAAEEPCRETVMENDAQAAAPVSETQLS
jgi:hypothetical protein